MHIRERIPEFWIQEPEPADAPPGRFLKNAAAILRQRYCLAPDFPLFEGHFPGQPVLPALGHVLLARAAAERLDGGELSIESIGQAKFLTPVGPGATLDVLLARPREHSGEWRFQHFLIGDAEPVEAARITMTFADGTLSA